MVPSVSPTWPMANSDGPGLSMCADKLHTSPEDLSALASLATQVQQLSADQALSQQQMQQMQVRNITVQC